MQIFVKTTTCQTQITLEVEPNDTIEHLKSKLKVEWEIPINIQKLAFRGERLENIRFLSDYNIQNKSMLQLLLPGVDLKVYVHFDNEEIKCMEVKRGATLDELRDRWDRYQREGVLE